MNAVVITGVSSGIGHATAVELARHGFHVFGTVRKRADADTLQQELGDSFTSILLDVTDASGIQHAATQVTDAVGDHGLRGLVNNSGICLLGPLMHMPEQQFRDHLEVNLFGALNVTRAFLPLLGAVKDCPFLPGCLVNISSLSGRIAYPLFGAYAASKFALEAISDSLRREMALYGVRVSVIEPGAIRTPIWDKGLAVDTAPYETTDYPPMLDAMFGELKRQRDGALPVERVARTIHCAITSPKPRTRYVLANSPLKHWWIPRMLPDRWLDYVLRRVLKVKKPGPGAPKDAAS